MKSQEANAIPLREILEKYGHEPVRSYHGYLMYSSPFRNEETPSFMVNLHTNKWKDFGEDSSGGVADLVMRLERCDFHSAMRRIEKSDLSAPSDPLPVPTSAGDAGTSPRLTVDNINPLTNRMLLNTWAGVELMRTLQRHIARKHTTISAEGRTDAVSP